MRITKQHLISKLNTINTLLNGSPENWTDGKPKPGAFVLDWAYGGVELQRYCNDGGGVTCVTNGYDSKPVLADKMSALIEGIRLTREVTA